jgi:drug/metabolite transporter (DMT)-like permease
MHPVGVFLALGAAVVYAIYIPVLGVLQQGRQPLDVARAISIGGAIVFVVWALGTEQMARGFGVVEVAASVGQGVLSTGAFLGFLAGLRVLGPVRTAITSSAEPFWTALLAVMMLGQPAGVGTLVGGLGIIVAVVLLQRPARPVRQP